MKKALFPALVSAMLAGQALGNNCDVMLKQSDFDEGTYQITDSNKTYCLAEDISFNPNSAAYLNKQPYKSNMPRTMQLIPLVGDYDPSAFGIGFFAAIAISGDNIVLDLKGHTLEQSEEHALMQRFFSIIETADRPFIPKQGPHDFAGPLENFNAANNLIIKNGKLGRSSHHAIHGNLSQNVVIKDIEFDGFEVAAVAMNGVDGLRMINLTAKSRKDVPVLGQFSTLQFIKPYLNHLANEKPNFKFNGKTARKIRRQVRSAINKVHSELIVKDLSFLQKSRTTKLWRLFHNNKGIVDGNAYGFLVNGAGVAVNGFPKSTDNARPSENITFRNVHVKDLAANIREITPLVAFGTETAHVKDPIGSIWQVMAVDPEGKPLAMTEASPNGRYVGNMVTDAQAIVAKAIARNVVDFADAHLDVSRNTISAEVIAWAESGKPLRDYLKKSPGIHGTGFLCNGDQMFHVNKGVIGFKMDGAIGVNIDASSAKNVRNIGKKGSRLCGRTYKLSHPGGTLGNYGGAFVRGMSISGTSTVNVNGFKVANLFSKSGSVFGVDALTDSNNINLKNISMSKLAASQQPNMLPTPKAKARGFVFRADTDNIKLESFCVKKLSAQRRNIRKVEDRTGQATIKNNYCR